LQNFLVFSNTGVNFRTGVMARWSGQRDRNGHGIPGVVADSGAGAARGGRQPECVRCRRARAPRVRERWKMPGVLRG
jgi:hypothetical protein